ncbi:MAG TPA: hypothetical protein VFP89_11335 [Propionibacteriaceae bacterium]|nr:hypothetical protein [Propionibacteriaceae bacterium]
MTRIASPGPASAYGARPVSIDIARGRGLVETKEAHQTESPITGTTLPVPHQVVADRLSLAHWPPGHQIVVCSLAGGAGRTTLAGLLATVLAELPFAHIRQPMAVVEAAPRTLGSTSHRWDLVDLPEPGLATSTRSGAWAFTAGQSSLRRKDFSVVAVDAPAGMPSDLSCIEDDRSASLLLVTRPDRASLAEAAEALVWMHDRSLVSRTRVVVVINRGVGQPDRSSRAAATALGIRCAAVNSLPFSSTLGPGRALPSGRDLPVRVRRVVSHVALDLWSASVDRRSVPPRING